MQKLLKLIEFHISYFIFFPEHLESYSKMCSYWTPYYDFLYYSNCFGINDKREWLTEIISCNTTIPTLSIFKGNELMLLKKRHRTEKKWGGSSQSKKNWLKINAFGRGVQLQVCMTEWSSPSAGQVFYSLRILGCSGMGNLEKMEKWMELRLLLQTLKLSEILFWRLVDWKVIGKVGWGTMQVQVRLA